MGMIGKKGVEGKILTIVVSLILALAALVFLWIFLQKTFPLITQAVDDMLMGLRKKICDTIPGMKILCTIGDIGKAVGKAVSGGQ